MSESSLPRSTPSEQGIDASGIDAFVTATESLDGFEPHGLVILRHGHVVAERYRAPYAAETPHQLYSLSKSLVSTALGFAVAELLVDLEAPVASFFPEFADEIADDRVRAVLVKHLAEMTTGHSEDALDRAIKAGDGDALRGFFTLRPDQEPGTSFTYDNASTYVLAAILQKVTGGPLTDYLRTHLFEPLGIEGVTSYRDAHGREPGSWGFSATTETIARIGQLYLENGAEILPPGWVAEATRAHVATPGPQADWSQGYGYQFWRSRHGYRGDGAYGQFMIVLPEQDAVVAITSAATSMQAVLDEVWTHLLPALTAGGGPTGPWTRADAPLTVPAGDGSGGELGTATFRPAADNDLARLQTVEVTGDGLVLVEEAGDLAVRVDPGAGWVTSGPVATAAAWTAGTLAVDLLFTETPHRLHLVLDPATQTFTARWRTAPLAPLPLTALHA
jgi:CubicO group peptidase (beta-lactamase class C family)